MKQHPPGLLPRISNILNEFPTCTTDLEHRHSATPRLGRPKTPDKLHTGLALSLARHADRRFTPVFPPLGRRRARRPRQRRRPKLSPIPLTVRIFDFL